MLRLTGNIEYVVCDMCEGHGKVSCPETYTSEGMMAVSTGAPIPCPKCDGKKYIEKGKLDERTIIQ